MTQDHSEDRTAGNAHYRSYLLRLWQEGPGSGERVLLQDVLGGEPRCFASLEGLFAYLDATRGQLEGGEGGGPDRGAGDASPHSADERSECMACKAGRATGRHP